MAEIRYIEPTEAELQAYVDDALGAPERMRVEEYLAANGGARGRVAAYRNQRHWLASLLTSLPDEPVPPPLAELQESFGRALARQRTFGRGLRASVAATAMAGALLIGWQAHEFVSPAGTGLASLTRQAAEAHILLTGDVNLPRAEPDPDGAELFNAYARRATGQALSPPDLRAVGFALVNGWLVPTQRGPAAQFLYRDNSGRALTFYAVAQEWSPSNALTFTTEGDLSILFWKTAGVTYSIVARLERGDLMAIAELVNADLRTKLQPKPSPETEAPITAGDEPKQEASATTATAREAATPLPAAKGSEAEQDARPPAGEKQPPGDASKTDADPKGDTKAPDPERSSKNGGEFRDYADDRVLT